MLVFTKLAVEVWFTGFARPRSAFDGNHGPSLCGQENTFRKFEL
jgi:hypothetical protein